MPTNEKWRQAVEKAVKIAGSQADLARMVEAELDPSLGLRCTHGHVWAWLNRADSFPPSYAMAVERATRGKVKAKVLCPGVF